MFKSRAVEIHCCVAGHVSEKDSTTTITIPEHCDRDAVNTLAESYALTLAAVWAAKPEEIQTTVSVVRTTREVEYYYDLSMSKRRRP